MPTQAHIPRADATPFVQYVAMGDSITAGFQSGGLTAASQRASYAHLLGERAGLDTAMPEVMDPGCPPPLGISEPKNCHRIHPDAPTMVVAVPGAKVGDVLRTTDTQVVNPDPLLYSPDLYRVIVGPGTTQLEAALTRRPVFVTLWIGNNDALLPTLRGAPDEATPVDSFRADYATLIERLLKGGVRHLVLLNLPDVTRVPALIPVRLLRLVGLVDASCQGQDVYFGSLVVAKASKAHPLSCTSPEALTAAKFAQAQQTVERYNEIIRDLAAVHGLQVFDVNTVLDRLPGRPLIPTPAEPFGRSFSRDGVHPSTFAHQEFARALATFLNQQFGTDLDTRVSIPMSGKK